jgi:hypothetical protein
MGDIQPEQFAGVMTALEVDAADVADVEPKLQPEVESAETDGAGQQS